jgi:hypothetical protein
VQVWGYGEVGIEGTANGEKVVIKNKKQVKIRLAFCFFVSL